MFKFINFFAILVLLQMNNNVITILGECLDAMFGPVDRECGSPRGAYESETIHAYHLCSYRALGLLGDNDALAEARSTNELAWVVYTREIESCAENDPPTLSHDLAPGVEPFHRCAKIAIETLIRVYNCPSK